MSEALIKEAAANGIFALLTVVLLFYTIRSADKREERLLKNKDEMRAEFKEMQDDSREREIALMDHLDKTNESHKEITESNRQLAESMKKLESKMDEGLSKVWERIDIIGRG